jgi:hypothetical protein
MVPKKVQNPDLNRWAVFGYKCPNQTRFMLNKIIFKFSNILICWFKAFIIKI